MQPSDKKLREIKKMLDEAEDKIATAKKILFEQVYQEQAIGFVEDGVVGPSTIVEGVFDGEEMIDHGGKKYPVPPNYASKSKLVAGDKLKLSIASDGTFVFKQTGPIERKRLIGKLSEAKGNYKVLSSGKKYNCLKASVTYFKANPGDEVTIMVPKNGESDWAALENCIVKSKKE